MRYNFTSYSKTRTYLDPICVVAMQVYPLEPRLRATDYYTSFFILAIFNSLAHFDFGKFCGPLGVSVQR